MEKQLSLLPQSNNSQKTAVSSNPQKSSKKTVIKKKKTAPWKIFVDGASRGNPGVAGAGVYIKQDDKNTIKKGFYLGIKTNNQAEYLAVALALFLLKKETAKEKDEQPYVTITSDSQLLVRQMGGEYKVKNPILIRIKSLVTSMLHNINYKFKHVLRSENTIADKLANQGINERQKMPASFEKLLVTNNIFDEKSE